MSKPEDYQLRAMGHSDKAMILRWRNSDRIRVNMYTDHIISLEEHEKWFASALTNPVSRFLIFEHSGRPLGLVSFTAIDALNERCSWAFYLGEEDVKRGTGSVMEFLALEFAFEVMRIRKLCCEVFAFNASVVRLHERFGFQTEGRLREHYMKGGRFEDVVVLAKFAASWPGDRDRLRPVVFRGMKGDLP
jgi:UDP-4-amino-4,6-dideoxy-N-acetyl-beta-L-altrosamine N-acetyltransferase